MPEKTPYSKFCKDDIELIISSAKDGEREKINPALRALANIEHSNYVGYYCRRAMLAMSREDFYEMNSAEIVAFIFSK